MYDGYGGVLSATLPATLTAQGVITDPDTGLVYLGDGRFYDPVMGRPLQPNPAGGPPAVPQALNRYAATPQGQPGVAEGVNNGIAIPQTDPLFIAFRDTAMQTALGYAAGKAVEVTAWGPLSISISQSTWNRTIGKKSLNLYSLFSKGVSEPEMGKTFRTYTTAGKVRSLGNDGRYLADTGQTIDTIELLPAKAKVKVAFSPRFSPLVRNILGGGSAFGISAIFQGVEDWNDPYLTSDQRGWRAGISGLGGLGAWGAGLITTEIAVGAGAGSWAGPIGIITGATVTFVWIVIVQPVIFKEGGLNPMRNLAPLQN